VVPTHGRIWFQGGTDEISSAKLRPHTRTAGAKDGALGATRPAFYSEALLEPVHS
jgi:hypothetical protein